MQGSKRRKGTLYLQHQNEKLQYISKENLTCVRRSRAY